MTTINKLREAAKNNSILLLAVDDAGKMDPSDPDEPLTQSQLYHLTQGARFLTFETWRLPSIIREMRVGAEILKSFGIEPVSEERRQEMFREAKADAKARRGVRFAHPIVVKDWDLDDLINDALGG